MIHRSAGSLVRSAIFRANLILLTVLASALPAQSATLVITPKVSVQDTRLNTAITGLAPDSIIALRAQTQDAEGKSWSSVAQFKADSAGEVDLSRVAPVFGSYRIPDAMGPLWSMMPDQSADPAAEWYHAPLVQKVKFTIEDRGQVLASEEVTRTAFDPSLTARQPVVDQPFVATYFRPLDSSKRHPAILVLGGSEGGLLEGRAALYSSHGFATMAVAYFGAPSLPDELVQIPLGYFEKILQFMRSQPEIDPNRIFVSGVSKGAELALLLASNPSNDIKGVVAFSGSAYVWQGISFQDPSPRSTWANTPFIPFQFLPGEFNHPPYSTRPLYDRSLSNASPETLNQAAIPVERIHGPVLLLSGEADSVQDSAGLSEIIMRRLDDPANGFSFPHRHLRFPGTGHLAFLPYEATGLHHFHNVLVGGSVEANALAAVQAWESAVQFFRDASR